MGEEAQVALAVAGGCRSTSLPEQLHIFYEPRSIRPERGAALHAGLRSPWAVVSTHSKTAPATCRPLTSPNLQDIDFHDPLWTAYGC